MRLLILSDLHREIYPNRNLGIDLEISKPDVVILAGDIDKGPRSIEWASNMFAGLPVLYVAGNHEFYGSNIDTVPGLIQQACDATPNVIFLNQGQHVRLNNSVAYRFLGATMWTDFQLFGEETRGRTMMAAETGLNDYHAIRIAHRDYRKLKPLDTLELHLRHREWISEKLDEYFSGKTVIISHMAPSMRSVPEEYEKDALTPCFASNLEDLAKRADLWIHGHTHTSMDYMLDESRVVCNPCGYVMRGGGNENPAFNPNFIVEI
jgi:predicted phosphodiesterase